MFRTTSLVCQSFGWRDYFAGAASACATAVDGDGAAADDSVYVSRAYVSFATNTVRFSLTTPVRDDAGRCIGVIEGAVESDRALGSFKLSDEGARTDDRSAVLLARGDRSTEGGALPDAWYVMLHDDVVAGSEHKQPPDAALRALAARDDARATSTPQLAWTTDAPLADADFHDAVAGGRWLAGIAPVGNTHFAVVVETKEAKAVAPNANLTRRLWQAAGIALAGTLVVALVLALLTRTRRR